jgi:hypothetical protein
MSNQASLKSILCGAALATASALSATVGTVVYEANFEQAELDQVPADFLVLDGGFVVKEDSGNRFLELPGAPLETFGCLFGPAQKQDAGVTARACGTGKGRRFPAFGVGMNGVSGYRLQLSPAKKQVELWRGDQLKVSQPLEWESGKWYHLRLHVRQTKPGTWTIEGKVWPQATEEPSAWTVVAEDPQELPAGRASVWGNPFSGTPIRYDDLTVYRLGQH